MEFQGRASAQGRVWVDPCVDPPRSDATRGPTGPRPGLDCEPKSRSAAESREEETQVHLAEGRGDAGPRRCFSSFGGAAAPGRGGPTPLATLRASGAFPVLLLPLTLQTTNCKPPVCVWSAGGRRAEAAGRRGRDGVRRGPGGGAAGGGDAAAAGGHRRLHPAGRRRPRPQGRAQGPACLEGELLLLPPPTPPPVPQLPPPGGLSRAPAPASRPGRGRPLAPSPSPSAPADEEPPAAPGTLRADPPPSPLRTCARRTWPRRSRS